MILNFQGANHNDEHFYFSRSTLEIVFPCFGQLSTNLADFEVPTENGFGPIEPK